MVTKYAARPTPSLAILEKLKEEMRELSQMRKTVVPLGKFVPPIDTHTPGIKSTFGQKVDL